MAKYIARIGDLFPPGHAAQSDLVTLDRLPIKLMLQYGSLSIGDHLGIPVAVDFYNTFVPDFLAAAVCMASSTVSVFSIAREEGVSFVFCP